MIWVDARRVVATMQNPYVVGDGTVSQRIRYSVSAHIAACFATADVKSSVAGTEFCADPDPAVASILLASNLGPEADYQSLVKNARNSSALVILR